MAILDGSNKQIHCVIHVPKIIKNLLFVSQIIDVGLTMEINIVGGKLKNIHWKVIVREMAKGNFYKLCVDVPKVKLNVGDEISVVLIL